MFLSLFVSFYSYLTHYFVGNDLTRGAGWAADDESALPGARQGEDRPGEQHSSPDLGPAEGAGQAAAQGDDEQDRQLVHLCVQDGADHRGQRRGDTHLLDRSLLQGDLLNMAVTCKKWLV